MTSTDINAKIGLKIKLLRMKMNISQETLAEFSNLSKNSIGAIERGESKVKLETVEKIAKALKVELKELVDVSKIDL